MNNHGTEPQKNIVKTIITQCRSIINIIISRFIVIINIIITKIKYVSPHVLHFLTLSWDAVFSFFYSSLADFFKPMTHRCMTLFRRLPMVIAWIAQLFSQIKIKIVQYKTTLFTFYQTSLQRIQTTSWVQQLLEASQHSARTTTLIATGFVNVITLAFPLALMQVYDRIIPNRSYSTLFLLFAGVVIALLLEMVLRISRSYLNLWRDTKYEYELSEKSFGKLIDTPLHEYVKMGAGARLQQLNILDQLKGFYNQQLLTTLFDFPFVTIFLFVVAYLGGLLVLIPLLMMAALVYCTFIFFQYSEKILKDKFEQEARENNFVIEAISNIHTVKSMGMESLLLRRYERLQTSGIAVNYRAAVEASDLMTIKMVASQLVVALIVAFGGLYVIHGNMTLGGLAACSLLAGRIIQPMNKGLGALSRWQTVNIVREQLDAVMSLPNDKKSSEAPSEIKGEITLRDVCFQYPDQEKNILDHINLTIPAGTVIGITGKEQGGKTTLLNILGAIILPASGEYLIDGHDVTEYSLPDLRHQIAYLSQSGELLRGTIMDNLSAFDENLAPTAHRLAKLLGLDEVIAKLPKGFDTVVGDRAIDSLSRGVIRRMVIARALARKPKIVLFDETNMNLDMPSDMRLRDVLVTLSKIATMVIISHRPVMLKLASVIYELREGKLALSQVPQDES